MKILLTINLILSFSTTCLHSQENKFVGSIQSNGVKHPALSVISVDLWSTNSEFFRVHLGSRYKAHKDRHQTFVDAGLNEHQVLRVKTHEKQLLTLYAPIKLVESSIVADAPFSSTAPLQKYIFSCEALLVGKEMIHKVTAIELAPSKKSQSKASDS